MDIFRREIDRRADRFIRVADLVVLLVDGFQTAQDAHRVIRGRLRHIDLLEAPDERAVLFEIIAKFLIGRAADAAERAGGQRRLQQFDASMAPPLVAPAPMTVWISSMNRTAPGWFSSSVTTAFNRSSKSPR